MVLIVCFLSFGAVQLLDLCFSAFTFVWLVWMVFVLLLDVSVFVSLFVCFDLWLRLRC